MKKTILLSAVLFLLAASVTAQDTITYYDSCYLFHPLPSNISTISDHAGLESQYWLEQYTVNTPTRILGVAITFRPGIVTPVPITSFDTTKYLAFLMKQTGNDSIKYNGWGEPVYRLKNLYAIDSAMLHPSTLKNTYFRYDIGVPSVQHRYVSCYEYYFDTPDTITDSFYVGRKYTYNSGPVPQEIWAIDNSASPDYIFHFPCYMDYYGQRIHPKQTSFNHVWGLYFPIVGYHCHGFRGKGSVDCNASYTGAILYWENLGEGATYEVTVDYPDGTVDTILTTDTSLVLQDLAEGTIYNCSVRRLCNFVTSSYDTNVYSLSVDYSFTTLSNNVDTSGSDTTGAAVRMVRGGDFCLRPNPATDRVDVTLLQPADDGILTVSDIYGRPVATQRIDADRFSFDVSALPEGAYMVRITTPSGTVTKKLLVQRR